MAKYTKDILLKELVNYYQKHGTIPVSRKFHIHQNNYRKYFGNWNNALREAGIPIFQHKQIDTKCLNCGDIIHHPPSDPRTFCSKSCNASYHNKGRKHSRKTKNKIRDKSRLRFPPRSVIRYLTCEVCDSSFYVRAIDSKSNYCYPRKTCSDICKSLMLSEVAKSNNLGGNWNRKSEWYTSPIAGKVHLESSWEVAVAKELDAHSINWTRPKDKFKWISESNTVHQYHPDFYLIDYDTYLDPKNDYLQLQDEFKLNYVRSHYDINLVVLNGDQLYWKSIKRLIGANEENRTPNVR